MYRYKQNFKDKRRKLIGDSIDEQDIHRTYSMFRHNQSNVDDQSNDKMKNIFVNSLNNLNDKINKSKNDINDQYKSKYHIEKSLLESLFLSSSLASSSSSSLLLSLKSMISSYRLSSLLIYIIIIILCLLSQNIIIVVAVGQQFSVNNNDNNNNININQQNRISQSIIFKNNDQNKQQQQHRQQQQQQKNMIKDFYSKKFSNIHRSSPPTTRIQTPQQSSTSSSMTTTFVVEPNKLMPTKINKQNFSDIRLINKLSMKNNTKSSNSNNDNHNMKKKTKMSPNLNKFSDLNVDLMFEDIFDVNTTHYNETYDDYDEFVGSTIVRPSMEQSESIHSPKKVLLPSFKNHYHYSFEDNRYHKTNDDNNVNERQQSGHINNAKSNGVDLRSKMIMMTKLYEPNTNQIIYTNYYNSSDSFNENNDNSKNQHNHQTDLVSTAINHYNHHYQPQLQQRPQQQSSVNGDHFQYRSSIQGDHILRPFLRSRTTTTNTNDRTANNYNEFNHLQYPQKLSLNDDNNNNRPKRRYKNDNNNEIQWTLPMIELKRLTKIDESNKSNKNKTINQQQQQQHQNTFLKMTTISPMIINEHDENVDDQQQFRNFNSNYQQHEHHSSLFNKRLPLLSNDEGFILTKPNVSDIEIDENHSMINNEQDDSITFNNHNHNNDDNGIIIKNHNEFQRRFGDLAEPPNRNGQNFNSFKVNNKNNNNNNRASPLIDEIPPSINDLELDDEFNPSRSKNTKKINNGQNFNSKNSNNNINNNQQPQMMISPPSLPQNPQMIFTPQGFQPSLHQMMPLFFDKFLAQLSNGQLPSPLPPSTISSLHSNHIDNDIGDLDAPMERRGGNGNNNNNQQQQFSNNEIIPTGNEFDAAFPTVVQWPKIFRFTDGRINLHDFEREKKRSRIKFNQKSGKSNNALFNIKRDSFLILHGGTFNNQ